MNRAELDAWFAQADDVLTDWHGGTDAMHAKVPDEDRADELAPAGDSYYSQVESWAAPSRWVQTPAASFDAALRAMVMRDARAAAAAFQAQMMTVAEVMNRVGDQMVRLRLVAEPPRVRSIPTVIFDEVATTMRERALSARRNRNTGPACRRGIDGHFRRRSGDPSWSTGDPT